MKSAPQNQEEEQIDMTAQDRLLNNLLKAVEEYNKEHKNKITPLDVLKIYLNMDK